MVLCAAEWCWLGPSVLLAGFVRGHIFLDRVLAGPLLRRQDFRCTHSRGRLLLVHLPLLVPVGLGRFLVLGCGVVLWEKLVGVGRVLGRVLGILGHFLALILAVSVARERGLLLFSLIRRSVLNFGLTGLVLLGQVLVSGRVLGLRLLFG